MCTDSYIDTATLGQFAHTTGGQLHYYPQFRVIAKRYNISHILKHLCIVLFI